MEPGIVVPFPPPPPKYRIKLYVQLTDHNVITQVITPWEGGDILEPWADFIEWYENTEGQSYLFTSNTSAVMAQRKNIISYKIDVEEY